MKLLVLAFLVAAPLAAQDSPPALSAKAATQLVQDWKARDIQHDFACLYVHREDSLVVDIDSVGPAGTARDMFCSKAGGIARFVDERPDQQVAFSDMLQAMNHNPSWIVATEIYATLKGQFGELTEVPLGLTVVRKPGTT